MLDLRIDDGQLIDGTGAPSRSGDLGIREGRIVAVGDVTEPARQTIDADGCIVTPGFIDIYTHYDAQVFWDPMLSPSCFHGVTTAIAGNCGFSIAPLAEPSTDYLMRMLARVEGMPLESLATCVPWSWGDFGSFLDTIDRTTGPDPAPSKLSWQQRLAIPWQHAGMYVDSANPRGRQQ